MKFWAKTNEFLERDKFPLEVTDFTICIKH